MSERELPLAGQVLAHTNFTDTYDGDRTADSDLEQANLITSKVEGSLMHKPVLDIDLPIKVLPSTTEGHFHLFIDKEITWNVYCHLIQALVDAGIVEDGYYGAALRRGYTAVRLPWIQKETNMTQFGIAITADSEVDRSTTYISTAIDEMRVELNDPDLDPEFVRLYALLALTKGEQTTLSDVHDAWAVVRSQSVPDNPSLVPFDDLSPKVQAWDQPYLDAIHRVAKRRAPERTLGDVVEEMAEFVAIDYRELLKKYINHVGEEESVTFLTYRPAFRFTEEEWAELLVLNAEALELAEASA